ncbi:hypothetical protein WA026_004990 [Henosepilachna vigintioctopunctata]|uniref:Cytochrome P450 n=1 Tax=Henosepilachna vigintioctopunctata TaxID=420089 RepID=A0AAW1USA4_9CUCU
MARYVPKVFALITIYALFKFIRLSTYWSRRKVKSGKLVPFFGELYGMIFGKTSNADTYKRLYNEVGNARYYGTYQFIWPVLVLKCPVLIKTMLDKSSVCFNAHRNDAKETVDPLWCRNLFVLKGDRWKDMRSFLSPVFCTGNLEELFYGVRIKARSFVRYFDKMPKQEIDVEFKDACTRITLDIISHMTMGVDVNSMTERDNRYYTMGKLFGDSDSKWRSLVFFSYMLCPIIPNLLGLTVFNKHLKAFFMEEVERILAQPIPDRGPSMLSFLIKEKHEGQNITAIDMAAQVFLFYLGGVENVSNLICFMAYELAENPKVQDKLIDEIDQYRSESLTYRLISDKMPYLKMVLAETLRKHPITTFTDRVVTKPYTIEPKMRGETPLKLEVGDSITVPIIAIHHDPDLFKNPEIFDPLRFSPERISEIEKCYIPFGLNPRRCIAQHFAELEVKIIFIELLKIFNIVKIPQTKFDISRTSFGLRFKGGEIHLGLKRRYI